MSNSIINVRFGSWHFQLLRDRPYVDVTRNAYHDEARKEPGWRWFEIYRGGKGVTRDEAQRLLKETPEFVAGPCPRCGATTFEEAATKCRPFQMPCGDYSCGSPDEGPNAENETGPLYQRNPDYDELDGYLWGWFAVDEGFTKMPPTWRGEEPR